MVVAVRAVLMVEVTADEVVAVASVRHGRVAAAGCVEVAGGVAFAGREVVALGTLSPAPS